MDIRVATTHKLAKIFYEASFLAKKLRVNNSALEGQILDSMRQVLSRAAEIGVRGPELVNVLIAVEAISSDRRAIKPSDVERSLGLGLVNGKEVSAMGYFDLVSVLYFARRRVQFKEAKKAAVDEIETRILAAGADIGARTEETLLFFDYVSCPHIDKEKKEILVRAVSRAVLGSGISIQTAAEYTKILGNNLGFVAWDGASHLRALLQRKELQPAYD